ncbi:MAG TPA: SusC/RagA family TonB-linked outer membrane protein, partial [Puia sp.]|nr:SusC/RagA family TonB-linked outer membrane protein [Puia sp.]
MILRTLCLTATCLFFHTRAVSQITYKGKAVSMGKVIDVLRKQTSYKFVIDPGVLERAGPVTLHLRNASIEAAMEACLKGQPLRYELDEGTVYIKSKEKVTALPVPLMRTEPFLTVRVFDPDGLPLTGATVRTKATCQSTLTGVDGSTRIRVAGEKDTLIVSYIGYELVERALFPNEPITIRLSPSAGQLDETVVTGYGPITQRQNTGDITVVDATAIGVQPVSNPLAALEGRVPGLVITQLNGMPGAGFVVRVRGENSIANGRDPFYLVDGVPFGRNNTSNSNITSGSSAGSLSPFYMIAPDDIGSIEVLKDADATAIYGSRGANGVILITTKRRRPGDSHLHIQLNSGISEVTRRLPLLNTRQYVRMRMEALENDGLKPDTRNAPELLSWDTTRSTDWGKYLIGGMAHTTDVQASLSGGGIHTQFLLGANYHHESTVFPGRQGDDRATLHGNWVHSSLNKRLFMQVNVLTGGDWNNQFTKDLTSLQLLDPHAPGPYDSAGNLVWSRNGVSLTNPMGFTREPYRAVSGNFLANGLFSYRLFPRWTLQLSPGYNMIRASETSRMPIEAQDPTTNPTASKYAASTVTSTWILESQLEFRDTLPGGVLTFLVGGSWQGERNTITTLTASGYTSDALLSVTSAAPSLVAWNQLTDYHYMAFFGRLNYAWRNKYFFNLTGRRDGSSRFGPGKQFGNFGALGVAWLFRDEKKIGQHLSFLSFGKLRGSYGLTGNDQIGDYHYLETWGATATRPYQGIPGFYPTGLANPDLAWETIRKLELAVELGFCKDRFFFTAAYYQHRSGNQLLPYALPLQAGFTSVLRNFPAVVQNTGWEFSLKARLAATREVQWTMTVIGTFPQNRLLSFPNLANSASANNLVVGKSLNILKAYRYTGVDAAKGVFTFEDVNKDG